MKYYTLDACAILALLWQEQGWEIIDGIFEQAENNKATLIVHLVTLTETYDIIHREKGQREANESIAEILTGSPIKFYDTTTQSFMQTFAEIKSKYKTHFSDSWVVATNAMHAIDGTILTADRGFDQIKNENPIQVLYFR